jgi:hypothetical protein
MWSLSLGAKISFGMSHMRMGRYGSAIAPQATMTMERQTMPGMNMSSVAGEQVVAK